MRGTRNEKEEMSEKRKISVTWEEREGKERNEKKRKGKERKEREE